MLASVFFFQPLGQLIAVLIAFATTAGWKSYVENIQAINGPQSCTVQALDPAGIECARTLDRSWRMIAGLGAVPAVIAIYFRFTIPESVSPFVPERLLRRHSNLLRSTTPLM